jgi:hypothetical protein
MNKRYIIKHCSDYEVSDKRWYEAHYTDGKHGSRLFTASKYNLFLQFTDLLDEAGYKYIENEDEY